LGSFRNRITPGWRSISGAAPRGDAEACRRDAFATDMRPAMREWAVSKGPPAGHLAAFTSCA